MIAPHIDINQSWRNEAEQEANNSVDRNGFYLVPGTSAVPSSEGERIKLLEAKVRQLNQEIYNLTSQLVQKDVLLQNFRVREQELKIAMFRA
ncbi:MAG: hypothetical protein JST84_29490 [Acidobacteria bacterium]|nr:hypothetical protein [Acidobacteriota bacterium]